MIKCTATPGGYSATQCKALLSVLDIQPTARSKGMFAGEIVNIGSGAKLGTRVIVKLGDHLKEGMVANVCPFCAGALRDFTDELKAFNQSVYDEYLADESDEPLYSAIRRAQELYNKILKDAKIESDDYVWHSGDLSDTQKDHVEIHWEVRWQFGGEANGDYVIPMTALFDDTWEASVRECASFAIKKYRS